jgi:hypothetical protein
MNDVSGVSNSKVRKELFDPTIIFFTKTKILFPNFEPLKDTPLATSQED